MIIIYTALILLGMNKMIQLSLSLIGERQTHVETTTEEDNKLK